jgi:Zn-dependent M28 family amino/carboxypeptidase
VEAAALPAVRDLARLLAPLGIEYQAESPAHGGADLRPVAQAMTPIFDLALEGDDYFEYHHTANDTFDQIDPEALPQIGAAYATWAYAVAEMDFDLGRAPEHQE